MLPLRILGFLCLIFSQCGAESTCPSHLDPLILEPAGVVGAYEDTLSVKCSTTIENHVAIYWVVGDILEDEDMEFVHLNLSLSDYNVTAQCRIKLNELHECSKDLEITVYKNPEVVSSIKHVNVEGEVTQYDLQCDVFNVAPVQNLVVKWYKNNEITATALFNSTTKTPVNETIALPVNISRSERVVQLRCEAQLDFGPRGEQLPVVSQTLNISAQYAPEMNPKNSTEHIYVPKGENVTLNCDAEGNPPPVFSWTCDGMDVLERTDTLTFTPVYFQSTCICRATNHLGNVTEEYHIYVSPSSTVGPPTQTTPEAQTVRAAACPLTLTPPRIVAEFGGPVSANCSTSVRDAVMGWESPVRGEQAKHGLQISWKVENLKLWDLKPLCYITLNEDHQCTVVLDVSVYKLPDQMFVSGPAYDLMEGNEYTLMCVIINVAPVNMLTVFWYQDDKELVRNSINITKKPDTVTDILNITAQRDHNGSKFRCEVVLDLGSNEPQSFLNTKSLTVYKTVVQYKPFFKSCPSHYNAVEDHHSLNNVSCQADGNPPPAVQWYHEGEAFDSWKPLGRNDSGTYTMEIANKNGRSNTSVEITVEYPPFTSCDSHYEVKMNPHSVINLSEDQIDGCSAVQSQLLRLLQSLVVLEHRVMVPAEEGGEGGPVSGGPVGGGPGNGAGAGFDVLGGEVEHVNPQQPMTSLQYLHGQPITAQGMFLCAVIRALHQQHACKMHPQWIGLITATLPYMGRVLRRVVASVTLQLCRNLDNLLQQYRYETGITDTRPQWIALCIPPDLILTVLEGVTAIIHYCLLDPSSQYHQLQVSVDQKHLAEARSGILSILHTIMSSVTLLWSVLHQADSSDKPAAASAASTSNINLGSTKNLRQQILELLGPISMNHGAHFMAAIAYVWNERKQVKTPVRNKVIPVASEEQLLLVELVRSVSAMRTETVMQTVKEVLKQPPAIAKDKKHLSLEVCMLQFFYAYVQRIPVSSLVDSWPSLLALLKDSVQLGLPAPGQFLILGVLNEFILKNPNLESKKDQRELQDVTHKVVEAIGTIAGSSLEQTTWLRRNLEVKASPQIVVDGSNLEADVEDLMLTVMEASSFTPSVYSVHALTLLAEVLAHLLDMVFYSDEKEKVIPLLVNIMHYVVPYLRNHSAHNAPSYRACIQLLSSLSGYQYTRRAWKKEAFDLFMDHTFFQMDSSCVSHWRAIIDHLMTHDKTTFRDLMTRVAVAQSSSLSLFTNRDAELEQRAMLLKRLAFTIYSSEVDQYQKYLPDIQERLVESLRLPQVPILHAQVFLFFRVLLLRMSPQHLTSLWPTMITELVQVFLLMEQELTADEDISRTSGPSIAGLETTYSGGNGFSTSYNSQRWLNLYLSACKLLDLALALPPESLPQFQMYRWAFIPEASDDSGLEVRRQGTHQREFKPYVVRLVKLLRKRAKKNPEEDCSTRTLSWEPGHLMLTLYVIRSMEQLLPFFNLLSQVFNSKASSRSGPAFSHNPADAAFPSHKEGHKLESQKVFWSRARQNIEEMVEKDFLEGLIKT